MSLLHSPYKNIFILGLLVYLVTSFFSEGYYHPDEHFQILEFSNYKLGNSPASDLPWEFKERIRPALQPVLAMSVIKALNIVGIHNPFTYALILRISSALLSWFIVCKLCSLLIQDFSSETGKRIFLFLSLFLWFIPYISVRFSSENLSAITFLSAVYFILRSNEGIDSGKIFPAILAGLLLGFSFFFRFQIGFAILGLGLWMILYRRKNWKEFLLLIISALCSISFCIYLDYWFYGDFEITPYNYFLINIIRDRAANYGTAPWWYYFTNFIIQGIPPISILLFAFLLDGFYKIPKHLLTWCIIPFLAVHFLIGHKEMRFMFPMVFSFTYLAARGIDFFVARGKYLKAGRIIFVLCIIINIPLLLYKMITPSNEAVSYYKFLYNNADKKEVVLFCKKKSIYELQELTINFYKSPGVRCVITEDDKFIAYLNKEKPDSVYLLERNVNTGNKFPGYTSESIYCLYPKWLLNNNFYNWQSRASVWDIRQLKRIN